MNNKKILVIAPSWLGDLVMAQSLLIMLKQQGAKTIDLLAPKWCLDIAKCMPEVDNLIESNLEHGELAIIKRYQLGKKLSKNKYDQAIVLPNSFKSALVPFFAKIPMRTGWIGEMRYGLLNDIRILDKNKLPLMITRYAQLASTKQETIIENPPEPRLVAKSSIATLNKFKLMEASYILAPGAAGGSAKRWPTQYYTEVAKHLISQGKHVLLMGSKNDRHITDVIAKAVNSSLCHNLAGELELTQTVDVIASAKVLVTNDSGLMHVASALATSVIVIYGPTSKEHTPPLGNKAITVSKELACSPCFKKECPLKHHECMLSIKPQQIINTIEKVETL